jgi:hypothetical protein
LDRLAPIRPAASREARAIHVDVRMEARGAVCAARTVATARERVPKPSIAEEIVRVFYVLQMRSIHEQE